MHTARKLLSVLPRAYNQPIDAANITDLDYNETRNILATASIEGLKVWDLSDYSNTKLLFSGKLTSYNLYYGSVRFSPRKICWQRELIFRLIYNNKG